MLHSCSVIPGSGDVCVPPRAKKCKHSRELLSGWFLFELLLARRLDEEDVELLVLKVATRSPLPGVCLPLCKSKSSAVETKG